MEKDKNNSLLCFLCNKKFQQPKILDCLHNYCQKCLQDMQESKQLTEKNIRCPICRQTTELSSDGIGGGNTNFFLVRLVDEATVSDALKSETAKVSCESCEQEAVARCYDCAIFLCQACEKIHGRLPVSSEHDVWSLDECRASEPTGGYTGRDRTLGCRKHPEDKCRFFCKTCNELICRDCTVLDHCANSHRYVNLEAAAPGKRQSAKDLISRLEKKLPDFQMVLEVLNVMKDVLKDSAVGTRAQVQAVAEKMRNEITAKENGLLRQIRHESQKQSKELREAHKKIVATLEDANYSLEAAKRFVEKSKDSEFLWLYSTLESHFRGLVETELPSGPRVVKFIAEDDVDIRLGHLELEGFMDAISTELLLQNAKAKEMSTAKRGSSLKSTSAKPKQPDASYQEKPTTEHVVDFSSGISSESELDRALWFDKPPSISTKPPPPSNNDSPDGRMPSKSLTNTSTLKTGAHVRQIKRAVPPSSRVLRSSTSQDQASSGHVFQQEPRVSIAPVTSTLQMAQMFTSQPIRFKKPPQNELGQDKRGIKAKDGDTVNPGTQPKLDEAQGAAAQGDQSGQGNPMTSHNSQPPVHNKENTSSSHQSILVSSTNFNSSEHHQGNNAKGYQSGTGTDSDDSDL